MVASDLEVDPCVNVTDASVRIPNHGARHSGANPEPDDCGRFIYNRRGVVTHVNVLRNINIALKKEDRLAIVGENGAGKTSLLQLLAGLLPPDRGEVIVKGRTSNLINIQTGMQPSASGMRNITLRGIATGHSMNQIKSVRDDILDFVDIGEFIHMPTASYSSGMRMRLNFAIATAFPSEILILDEWLSAGDERFKEKAAKRMKQFVEKAGILILASHNLNLLRRNCNRAIWMHAGQVHSDGELDQVLDEYTAFCAK